MQSRATPHNLRDRFLLWDAIRESEQIIADSGAGRSARSERAAASDDLRQRAGLPSSQRSPGERRKNLAQLRLTARSIRDIARLKYGLGRSHREIAAALGIAVSTVGRHASLAAEAGSSWPRCRKGWTTPHSKRRSSQPSRCPRVPARSGLGGDSPRAAASLAGVPHCPSERLTGTAASATATRRGVAAWTPRSPTPPPKRPTARGTRCAGASGPAAR